MARQRCLFCNETVEAEQKDNCDWYFGCMCSPGGMYGLMDNGIERIQALSYQTKRELFPIVSAYIRELTDNGEKVVLSAEDLNVIESSPRIPVTIEDKKLRLLQFLHRHSGCPGEPVIIRQLSKSCNITYSPNLQELVYIITNLIDENSIEREGATFKLTEKGWREAVASAGGRAFKPCVVLLSDVETQRREWSDNVLPTIEQCGYLPQVADIQEDEKQDCRIDRLLAKSKLVIADLSGQCPHVYFAAGLALGMNKTVLWTLRRDKVDSMPVHSGLIRPLVWDSTEELAAMMHQRLAATMNI